MQASITKNLLHKERARSQVRNKTMIIKKAIIFSFVLLFLLSFREKVLADPNPSAQITLDGKEWKLRFKDKNSHGEILEYVTNNESVDKWTELVSLQKFKFKLPKEVTLLALVEKEVANLKAKGYQYTSTMIESTTQEVIVEFRVDSPAAVQQDEIQRIIKTPDDELVVFHYAIRKNTITPEERIKWVNALKEITY
jgi:hypothetical protein